MLRRSVIQESKCLSFKACALHMASSRSRYLSTDVQLAKLRGSWRRWGVRVGRSASLHCRKASSSCAAVPVVVEEEESCEGRLGVPWRSAPVRAAMPDAVGSC